MEYIYITLILFFAVLYFFYRYYSIKKARLSKDQVQFFSKKREEIQNSKSSPKEKVIDYDKLYHKILLAAGYKWNFWEILKSEPLSVQDLNTIWHLHKVRNTLVHEFDAPKNISLVQTAHNYGKEVIKLLRELA